MLLHIHGQGFSMQLWTQNRHIKGAQFAVAPHGLNEREYMSEEQHANHGVVHRLAWRNLHNISG